MHVHGCASDGESESVVGFAAVSVELHVCTYTCALHMLCVCLYECMSVQARL
jgi:hypothetical protein